jgi:glycosyltransferase involved in cell wall biosynthesis
MSFGLLLLQAIVHGTSVSTSNSASIPEVVSDVGLLIDCSDVNSIRQGLMRFLQGNKEIKALANLAKANARRFSWNYVALETPQVFEEAVSVRQLALREW